MKKIYIVEVMNRFDCDRTTPHYFTTTEKANAYADRLNREYEEAREAGKYCEMVYHVDKVWGIKEVNTDEED